MSVTKQIVKLLSAKYNFPLEEALDFVTTQQKASKSMTKEEKALAKKQEKEQAKAAKEQTKADAKAAKEQAKAEKTASKAEKEAKPKKPRTEAQIAATAKMIEANKLKKIAAASAK